jgi:hypothetical protein
MVYFISLEVCPRILPSIKKLNNNPYNNNISYNKTEWTKNPFCKRRGEAKNNPLPKKPHQYTTPQGGRKYEQ